MAYISEILMAWLIQPSHVCDDDLESPSEESIWSALRLVAHLCRQKKELPQRIVMDGEGGIVMDEFGQWQIVEYVIDRDGQIERRVYINGSLVRREDVILKHAVLV